MKAVTHLFLALASTCLVACGSSGSDTASDNSARQDLSRSAFSVDTGGTNISILSAGVFRPSGEFDTESVSITTESISESIDRIELQASGETRHFQVSIALTEDELIYGLTERLRDSAIVREETNGPMAEDLNPVEAGSLNRRGEIVEMFVRPTIALYAPFYHSSRGYGLWVEGTMPGSFDIGASNPETLNFRFETEPGQASNTLVFHIFHGPSYKEILRDYHSLTGYPIRVPDWAFKHWRWRDRLPQNSFAELDGVQVNAKIAEDVKNYQAFGIPFGVYLFDRPYLQGSNHPDSGGFGSFRWDESIVPNPAATLQALQSRGMEIAVWITSWALDENGSEARAQGFLAPGGSRVIDLTNPAAFAWWQNKLSSFFATWGIRGVKLDRGEEYVPSSSNDIWHDGRSGRAVHNDFPILQSKVVHDALQAVHGTNSAVLARAAYSGSQRYAAHWGGDSPGQNSLGLRMAIINLQRSAFLGFPTWGSDTGGYSSFTNREVFARWLQFSALCPIMEIGGQGSHAPWDMPTEPRFDEEMISIYRRYVSLHHDLIPYTAGLADLAHAQGMPIARPMIVEFPDDSRFLDAWDQYMYGPDYLVAPIWREAQRSRTVIIPEGNWAWYWDRSQTYTGPATVSVQAELDTLPLFVKQ